MVDVTKNSLNRRKLLAIVSVTSKKISADLEDIILGICMLLLCYRHIAHIECKNMQNSARLSTTSTTENDLKFKTSVVPSRFDSVAVLYGIYGYLSVSFVCSAQAAVTVELCEQDGKVVRKSLHLCEGVCPCCTHLRRAPGS